MHSSSIRRSCTMTLAGLFALCAVTSAQAQNPLAGDWTEVRTDGRQKFEISIRGNAIVETIGGREESGQIVIRRNQVWLTFYGDTELFVFELVENGNRVNFKDARTGRPVRGFHWVRRGAAPAPNRPPAGQPANPANPPAAPAPEQPGSAPGNAPVQDARFAYTLDRTGVFNQGRYFNKFPQNWVAGKTYEVAVESRDFVPFLYIRDSNDQALAVDRNDKSKPTVRVRLTPRATSTYYIFVTSKDLGKTGRYSMQIQLGAAPATVPGFQLPGSAPPAGSPPDRPGNEGPFAKEAKRAAKYLNQIRQNPAANRQFHRSLGDNDVRPMPALTWNEALRKTAERRVAYMVRTGNVGLTMTIDGKRVGTNQWMREAGYVLADHIRNEDSNFEVVATSRDNRNPGINAIQQFISEGKDGARSRPILGRIFWEQCKEIGVGIAQGADGEMFVSLVLGFSPKPPAIAANPTEPAEPAPSPPASESPNAPVVSTSPMPPAIPSDPTTTPPASTPRPENRIVKMPAIIGLTKVEAQKKLEELDWGLRIFAYAAENPEQDTTEKVTRQNPEAGSVLDRDMKVRFHHLRHPSVVTGVNFVQVPHVEGMQRPDAVKALEAVGLKAKVELTDDRQQWGEQTGGDEQIAEQEPPTSTQVKVGTEVALSVEMGVVPNVLQMNEQEAEAALRQRGFLPEKSTTTTDQQVHSHQNNRTNQQIPAANTRMPKGYRVKYHILSSTNVIQTVAMPDLKGMTKPQVDQRLEALGIRQAAYPTGQPRTVSDDMVVKNHIPNPGERVPRGTRISVYYVVPPPPSVPNAVAGDEGPKHHGHLLSNDVDFSSGDTMSSPNGQYVLKLVHNSLTLFGVNDTPVWSAGGRSLEDFHMRLSSSTGLLEIFHGRKHEVGQQRITVISNNPFVNATSRFSWDGDTEAVTAAGGSCYMILQDNGCLAIIPGVTGRNYQYNAKTPLWVSRHPQGGPGKVIYEISLDTLWCINVRDRELGSENEFYGDCTFRYSSPPFGKGRRPLQLLEKGDGHTYRHTDDHYLWSHWQGKDRELIDLETGQKRPICARRYYELTIDDVKEGGFVLEAKLFEDDTAGDVFLGKHASGWNFRDGTFKNRRFSDGIWRAEGAPRVLFQNSYDKADFEFSFGLATKPRWRSVVDATVTRFVTGTHKFEDLPWRFISGLNLSPKMHIQGMAVFDNGDIAVDYNGSDAGQEPNILIYDRAKNEWFNHDYTSPDTGHCSSIQAAGRILAVGHDAMYVKFFDCSKPADVKELEYLELTVEPGALGLQDKDNSLGMIGFAYHPEFDRYVVFDSQNGRVWISSHSNLTDEACRWQEVSADITWPPGGQGGNSMIYIPESYGPGCFVVFSMSGKDFAGVRPKFDITPYALRITKDSPNSDADTFSATQEKYGEKYYGFDPFKGDPLSFLAASFHWAGAASSSGGTQPEITIWASPARLDDGSDFMFWGPWSPP